jgi:hypothetical protein
MENKIEINSEELKKLMDDKKTFIVDFFAP